MNLGFSEMAFLFLVALILFGPKRLPEIGRQVGGAIAQFKRAASDLQTQITTEVEKVQAEVQSPTPEVTSLTVMSAGSVPVMETPVDREEAHV